MSPRRVRSGAITVILATLLFGLAHPGPAHDIPTDVTVQAFVKPAGQQLQLLLRVPLKAMRDMDFPEQEGGYLDIERLGPLLPDAATLWIGNFFDIREEGVSLATPSVAATQVSVESDRSFQSFEEALSHVTDPKLPNSTYVVWNQVFLDVLFEYQIHSDQAAFAVRPGLERLGERVVTVLRFLPPGGELRAFEFEGDPGLVPLDPGWSQAALRFVESGFFHILDGPDHLLFLVCLVIPFRRFRELVLVVTAFTVAHSITLIASAYNFGPDALWFPPLIEALIAMSIVYMALENIAGASNVQRRWVVTFGFGLVHGFGFSFLLRESLQFAGSHLLTSLVSFNLGVELGQRLVLVALVPALELLFRYVVAERMGTIILSALVAHTAWHWMIERWEVLQRFPWQWPALTASLLASAARWAMAIVALAGLAWLLWLALGALRPRLAMNRSGGKAVDTQ